MNQEVTPAKRLQGVLNLPADKSISHRSAMFAALHRGTSTITNFSDAADPHSTISCLKQLGIRIREDDHKVVVEGKGREGLTEPEEALHCGNSGTTMRLMSGILGGAGISCILKGDESLSGRTMKRILGPLRQMDVDIRGREDNFAPLQITRTTTPVSPISFTLPIPSAQLKSCVLLAGLFGNEPTTVIESVVSRDHTERLLNLPVRYDGRKKVMQSSRSHQVPEQSYRIPNDFSAAAFWLVGGSIHADAKIQLDAVGMNPTRIGALTVLKKMGADISVNNQRNEGAEPVADLQVASSELQAITVDKDLIPNCIDELPILIIAMLYAKGTSTISGAEELRHKETDRLSAMADMLEKAGAAFTEMPDGFIIQGDPGFVPEPSSYSSFHDHRIAMAGAILALMGSQPSVITDAECTAISYPSFWDDLSTLTN